MKKPRPKEEKPELQDEIHIASKILHYTSIDLTNPIYFFFKTYHYFFVGH